MLDFIMISARSPKKGIIEIYPKFIVRPNTKDLMIRGGDFYAVWDEAAGLWSTSEGDALALIDKELDIYVNEHKGEYGDEHIRVLHLWDGDTGMIDKWHKYVQKQMRDTYHPLDEKVIFSNTMTTKDDYASKKLPYAIENTPVKAYDELMSVLYSPEERKKIEWAIGSIVAGESKNLQKFLVLYGAAGTGKSTVLNIIQDLFTGYYSVFDAKALGSSNNSFALEAFKSNPLVAIQHDGDLSKIEDNTRLNSLVSHELMTVNEKFKGLYSNRFNSFLFMGTNKPVKITDSKSGILRRLIDVSPTGEKIPAGKYKALTKQIKFELGGIAFHCMEVYLSDPGAYDNYVPVNMLGASNDFYNFMLDNYDTFRKDDGITLKAAWELYLHYCEETKVMYPLTQRVFKEELKTYFKSFQERARVDEDLRVRNYFSNFRFERFENDVPTKKEDIKSWLEFSKKKSLLDEVLKDCPAQYASESGTPITKWADVTTTLKDLDTKKLHYAKLPNEHIFIDFDIKDPETGEKSLKLNSAAASLWPPTYAELSKSGQGIHLHYIYTGDTSKLQHIYDPKGIEIKTFNGNSSLRRQLSKCNDIPIATISSGLPLTTGGKMIDFGGIKNEEHLINTIKKHLRREIVGSTHQSVQLIYKTLEEAYASDLSYDISFLKSSVYSFAESSSNHAKECRRLVHKMHFQSADKEEAEEQVEYKKPDKYVFFDIEVFPNLLVVVWKMQGKSPIAWTNPTPEQIEELLKYKLIGFNCRRYDNHILYARLMGFTNEEIFKLSQRIIKGNPDAFFSQAYNASYADMYDISTKKQSLKKFELEFEQEGKITSVKHHELGLDWDKPVPEDKWAEVAEYCIDDVLATEAVYEDRKEDFMAREVLADISKLRVNDTTRSHTTKIIFGDNKHPELVYTDLSKTFPGYEFVDGHINMYRGVDLGMGGYVYAEPGMYTNVALLDVASLHPSSIIAMNCFGQYTKRFEELKNARIMIKHHKFDEAKKLLGGALAPYLDDESKADGLAFALKIAINSVYGYTSASFDNPFKDPRNVNNIVALRGALFMKTLQDEVVKRGYQVIHIKTDSIKIPNATPEIVRFCMDFAKKYQYEFELEAVYDRITLVNDAVYIAKYADVDYCIKNYGDDLVMMSSDTCKKNKKAGGTWTATGAQFQQPYVFKTLFSKEPIVFNDMTEIKTVTSSLYLDTNEHEESELEELEGRLSFQKKLLAKATDADREKIEGTIKGIEVLIAGCHHYHFIGKAGRFCPVKPGNGGGILLREKDGKFYAATGSKGYRWLEAEMVRTLNKMDIIDRSYYDAMVDEAVNDISKYGDFEWFANG